MHPDAWHAHVHCHALVAITSHPSFLNRVILHSDTWPQHVERFQSTDWLWSGLPAGNAVPAQVDHSDVQVYPGRCLVGLGRRPQILPSAAPAVFPQDVTMTQTSLRLSKTNQLILDHILSNGQPPQRCPHPGRSRRLDMVLWCCDWMKWENGIQEKYAFLLQSGGTTSPTLLNKHFICMMAVGNINLI